MTAPKVVAVVWEDSYCVGHPWVCQDEAIECAPTTILSAGIVLIETDTKITLIQGINPNQEGSTVLSPIVIPKSAVKVMCELVVPECVTNALK